MKEFLHDNHFLFIPGEWAGEGIVSFSFSPDELVFRMTWTVYEGRENSYMCVQTVYIEEQEPMVNAFKISPKLQGDSLPVNFDILLENVALGSFLGKGVIQNQSLAWEFRYPGTLDGYEVYERIGEGEYLLRAEYCGDDVRTMIQGRIHRSQGPS